MQQAGDIITLAAGAYRLRERLAGSSYGVLWKADAPGATGPVAIKLVNREQLARAEEHQRAHWRDCAANEIAFLRSLQPWDGRHIVRLVDSGEHDGLPSMALELLDGDLARHVAAVRDAGATIAPFQVVDWIAQVNQALAKVHQYGWRYLDLKPSNLLLDVRSGAIKLADFGTNRPLADVHPHAYAGSARWQAPEQFFPAGARYETDARTDYFALGALFYYLATGGQPLRFCSDCAAARREHGAAAAAHVLRRHGGALPPVLQADEAALFVRRIGMQPGDDRAGRRAAAAALALLRALLSVARAGRPRHALDISRALANIGAPLRTATSVELRSAA